MKLYQKVLIITCLSLTILWIVGRATNALQYLRIVAESNQPSLKPGELIFSSVLKKPQLLDFICFRYDSPEFGKEVWIFRLCGLEGDKVEIKDGTLYVNETNVDASLNLYHLYTLGKEDFSILQEKLKLEPEQYFQTYTDSFICFTNDKFLRENQISGKKNISRLEEENSDIQRVFARKWNKDNFGPITVPAGKYFVLGDSRDNAQDSRYIGLIDKKDFVGTVIGKK
ncbi:MAG: signal peptidase I [Agriterribacter sp.]